MLERLLTATAKKSYVALFDQALVSGTNFLTGVLLARLCSKEQYGLYVLAFSVILLWDGLRGSLIASPQAVFLHQKPSGQQPPYLGSTIVMHALLLVMGAVVLGVGAGIVRAASNTSLAAAILAGTFALCGYSSREHVRRTFYAQLYHYVFAGKDGENSFENRLSFKCERFAILYPPP